MSGSIRVQFAFHHNGQIVKRQFDAMVGDAVLRKIVGADSFVAFAGADLRLALRGVFGVFLGDFRSSKRERNTFNALALFFCCERSSAQRTIKPLGLWII